MALKNLKITLAYDGTSFLGWQETKEGRSVEGTLKAVLLQILQENYICNACSRTDRGVHALAQVVSLFTRTKMSLSQLFLSLNSLLPKEIRIVDIVEMPWSFHPTLDSIAKEYTYTLCLDRVQLPQFRNYSWHVNSPLDVEKMRQAAYHLVGKHDFSAFCNMRKNLTYENTIREIFYIKCVEIAKKRLTIQIKADHFLYKMARNLVGTLVYAGKGKIKPTRIHEILESQKRILAGVTAPSHGLCLTEIFYPDER